MEGFEEVMPIDQLQEGKLVAARIGSQEVCLLRIGDRFYCFSNVCTHIGGRLSEGHIGRETYVVCPEHRAVFDAETGKSLSFPRRNLVSYEVKVIDGLICVRQKSQSDSWRENLPSSKDERYKWID